MNRWTIGNETLIREGRKWRISLLVEGYHKGAAYLHHPGRNEVREVSREEAGEFLRRWREVQDRIEKATKNLKPVSKVEFENVDLGDGFSCWGRQVFDQYDNFVANIPPHIDNEAELKEWFQNWYASFDAAEAYE